MVAAIALPSAITIPITGISHSRYGYEGTREKDSQCGSIETT